MKKNEAREYLIKTNILQINLSTLKKACFALKNDPSFLINYPDYLGLYYKDIEPSAWNNVLFYKTSKPSEILSKLKIISYMVYSTSNLDTYLSCVYDVSGPIAIALSKKDLDSIDTLFLFTSKKFYCGFCEDSNKYILYIVKK